MWGRYESSVHPGRTRSIASVEPYPLDPLVDVGRDLLSRSKETQRSDSVIAIPRTTSPNPAISARFTSLRRVCADTKLRGGKPEEVESLNQRTERRRRNRSANLSKKSFVRWPRDRVSFDQRSSLGVFRKRNPGPSQFSSTKITLAVVKAARMASIVRACAASEPRLVPFV
jgi:hypothetical protein